jgi:quinol monooxygenase YgiN
MAISLIAALVGAVVALGGTIMLVIRCVRLPRGDLIAWTCAMFGLAVALVAQSAGFAVGFGSLTFRAVQLGAQVVAVLGLALGLAEVAARTPAVRFAARLAVSALGVVGVVILATDPLDDAGFSKVFPAASVHYQVIANSVLIYGLAPAIALTALIAIGCSAVRARRDPAWRATFPAVAAAGLAGLAMAVPGLADLAGNKLGTHLSVTTAFPVLCLLAAAGTWIAVAQVSRIRLDVVHRGSDDQDNVWGRRPAWDGSGETGTFGRLTEIGRYGANGYRRHGDDQGYGRGADDTGFTRSADDTDYEPGPDDTGFVRRIYDTGSSLAAYQPTEDANGNGHNGGSANGGYDGYGAYDGTDTGLSAAWQPGAGGRAGMLPGQPGMPEAGDQEAWSLLFGQIAIYTLLEDRVEDFDELTEVIVEQVRVNEPETLVYIFHAVPSAPMQRILYEVYRDREAYEDHGLRPYIAQFEADRRPYVLATNVVELGLQRAKVSPFPSLSDLLTGPGPAVRPGTAARRAAEGGPGGPGGRDGRGVAGGRGRGRAGQRRRTQRLP